MENIKFLFCVALVLGNSISLGSVQGGILSWISDQITIEGQKSEARKTCNAVIHSSKPQAYQGLAIALNVTSRIFLVTNRSAPVAVGIDPNNDMFLLWDGIMGWVGVVDMRRGKMVAVTPIQSPLAYTVDAHPDPQEYFLTTVSSFQVYFDIPYIDEYDVEGFIPRRDLDEANTVNSFLIGGPVPGHRIDRKAGIKLDLKLAQTTVNLLNGPLKEFTPYFNGKTVLGNGNMLVKVMELLGRIFSYEFDV